MLLRSDLHQSRITCSALRHDWQRRAGRLDRYGLDPFRALVSRQVGETLSGFEAALAARCDEVTRRAGVPPVSLPGAAGPRAHPDPPRRSALENRLSAVLGAGFGLGASLTAARLLADLGATAPTLLGCGGLGASLTWWVIRARRLLADRAALERWAAEVAAGLRMSLEERVLAAEATLSAAMADSRARRARGSFRAADPPDCAILPRDGGFRDHVNLLSQDADCLRRPGGKGLPLATT